MNTESLKKIISSRFSQPAIDVRQDIFRIDAKYNEVKFATYFFDCTNSFLSKDFDLLEYQNELLASDYYATNGPMQWNLYLFFVTDSLEISQNRKQEIESDKSFSRKLVTSEEDLVKLIEVQQKIKTHSKPMLDTALLSVWKEKLRTVNLQGVYLLNDYPKIPEIFQIFIDEGTFKEPVEIEREVLPSETIVSTIEHLTIEGYRSAKSKFQHNFKKVNLIKGVNGTGKTSLLEAIELCICGQTLENPSKSEQVKTLAVKYTNGNIDRYDSSDNKRFQARDRLWYGNNTLRGNNLSQQFHVYNFFDSDAAFRFSNETSGDAVEQIFSSIIMGEQTNLVFDRIQKIFDRISSHHRQLKLQLVQNQSERISDQSKLDEFDSSSTVITLLSQIIESLEKIKWNGATLLLSEGENRKEFQNQLSRVNTTVKGLENVNWIERPTLTSLKNELLILEQLISTINNHNTTNKDSIANLQRIIKSKELINRQINTINNSIKYYSELDIIEIVEIEQKLIYNSNTLSRLQKGLNTLANLDEYAGNNVTINESLLKQTISELESEQSSITKNLQEIEDRIGRAQKIKAELKAAGFEYIQLTGKDDHCPLCNTSFTNGKLRVSIESIQTIIGAAEEIAKNASRLSKINNSLTDLRSKLLELVDFKLTKEFSKYAQNQTLGETRALLKQEQSRLEEEHRYTKQIFDRFTQNNLTEFEYKNLNVQLKESGLDLIIGKNQKDEFDDKRIELLSAFEELSTKEFKEKLVRDESQQQVIESLTKYYGVLSIDESNKNEFVDRTSERYTKLKLLLSELNNIEGILNPDPNQSLAELALALDKAAKMFQEYKEVESNNKIRQDYVQRISSLKTKSERLSIQEARFKKALEVLEEIITKNNRENFLKEFFAANKQNILDIFRSLHLPNEFEDIIFEKSIAIKLKVKGIEEYRDLTEISTGQKSAFILSLFLTLNNNLKSGPPIIIFDDPVTYVDDINTLSFLDFLREEALQTKKQIFFATANSKLSSLFQQKFAFMGDEFAVINLQKTY